MWWSLFWFTLMVAACLLYFPALIWLGKLEESATGRRWWHWRRILLAVVAALFIAGLMFSAR